MGSKPIFMHDIDENLNKQNLESKTEDYYEKFFQRESAKSNKRQENSTPKLKT